MALTSSLAFTGSSKKHNKCQKKTYKEALTGAAWENGNLTESEFPSFIPAGIEENKIKWSPTLTSTKSNQEKSAENKFESNRRNVERSGATEWEGRSVRNHHRPRGGPAALQRNFQARSQFSNSVRFSVQCPSWRKRRSSYESEKARPFVSEHRKQTPVVSVVKTSASSARRR